MPGDEPRDDFDLGVQHRCLLCLGKPAHIVMGEADVVTQTLGHLLGGRRDLVGRHDDLTLKLVELCRVSAGNVVAARLDLVEDRLHRGAHVCLARGGGLLGLLQIGDRHQARILSFRVS